MLYYNVFLVQTTKHFWLRHLTNAINAHNDDAQADDGQQGYSTLSYRADTKENLIWKFV